MRPASISANTVKVFEAGSTTAIEATVTYNAATGRATLNPNANLKPGTEYKAVVTTVTRDLTGNGHNQNPTFSDNQSKQWFFTVRN